MKHITLGLIGFLSLLAGWSATSFFIDKNKESLINIKPEVAIDSNNADIKYSKYMQDGSVVTPENPKLIAQKSNTSSSSNASLQISLIKDQQPIYSTESAENIKKNSIPVAHYTETLAGAFAIEEVDEQWAQKSEPKLRDQFTVDGPIMGAALKSVECKSTTCKITAQISNEMETQLQNLSRDIGFKIMTKQKEFFDPNIMTVYSKDDKTLNIYVSKINVSSK